jgi:Methyltransferase domain
VCHPSVHEWTSRVITEDMVRGMDVLECGSFDVNGSVKPHIMKLKPRSFLGIDIRQGPNVDRVLDVSDLPDSDLGKFSLVVSTEMLEHVADWRAAIHGMISALDDNGAIVITTRSPGFPLHEYPGDFWRYTVADMERIFSSAGLKLVETAPDWLPGHPGVFVHARRPQGHEYDKQPATWDDIEVSSVS